MRLALFVIVTFQPCAGWTGGAAPIGARFFGPTNASAWGASARTVSRVWTFAKTDVERRTVKTIAAPLTTAHLPIRLRRRPRPPMRLRADKTAPKLAPR